MQDLIQLYLKYLEIICVQGYHSEGRGLAGWAWGYPKTRNTVDGRGSIRPTGSFPDVCCG